jgi:chromodomain-helicase-DNA-binding protein 4
MTMTKMEEKTFNRSSHMALKHCSSRTKAAAKFIVRLGLTVNNDDTNFKPDSDQDIVRLLEKTEKEAVKETSKAGGGLSFSFAKIWAADKDSLDEVSEEDQRDSWAQTLAKINEETAKQQAMEVTQSGRGIRRKAADIAKVSCYVCVILPLTYCPHQSKINGDARITDTPKSKAEALQNSVGSDDSAYSGSDHESSIENDSDHAMMDDDFVVLNDDPKKRKGNKPKRKLSGDYPYEYDLCGLCRQSHGPGGCKLVEDSAKLAEYREMLIFNADDEPWEDRVRVFQNVSDRYILTSFCFSKRDAVLEIDATLHARGDLAFIAGQPLHPLLKPILPLTLPSSTVLPSRGNNAAHSGASANMPRNSTLHPTNPQVSASAPVPQKRSLEATSLSRNGADTWATSSKPEEPFKKKLKTSASPGKCPLCGSYQLHTLEKCSVVLAGPSRYACHGPC